MSHYHPFEGSHSTTHRPPVSEAATSSRPSREERSVKDRINVLVDRLDRAKDILLVDCSKGDRFAVLALGTLERNLKELVPVIKLIEQARSITHEEDGTSKRRKDDELVRKHGRNETNGSTGLHDTVNSRNREAPVEHRAEGFIEDIERTRHVEHDGPRVTRSPSRASTLDYPDPVSPASRPLPLSRPASTFSPDSTVRRFEQDREASSARSSVSKLFDRAKETVSPSTNRPQETSPQSSSKLDDEQEEKRVRNRDATLYSSASPAANPLVQRSHRSRGERTPALQPVNNDDDELQVRVIPQEEDYRPTRSRAGRSSSRSGRSVQTRKALELASAPPGFSDDDNGREQKRRHGRESRKKRIVRLDAPRVIETIASKSDQATKANLVAVSREFNKIIEPMLFGSVTVTGVTQAIELATIFKAKPPLAELVTSLEIVPLDSNSDSSHADPSTLIAPLQGVVSLLPNLSRLDEDFTKVDWDVTKVSPGSIEYPLLSDDPSSALESFSSKRCWWEIGAIHDLFTSQVGLKHVVFGGAAMDRDWEGSKLKASLSSRSSSPSVVESLTVAQVMHEETLSVLLLLVSNPRFRSLSISFQSIGPSDDDTPLSSIPLAFKLVSSSLTHLTLVAPSQPSSSRVAEDTSTLLEDVLPLVPNLSHLSFQETCSRTTANRVPIASRNTLTRRVLPQTLRVVRARQVFSIGTLDVLTMLDDPDTIPVLEELDVEWAAVAASDPVEERRTTAEDAGEQEERGRWNERQVDEIREACREYGIKVSLSKGDRRLSLS